MLILSDVVARRLVVEGVTVMMVEPAFRARTVPFSTLATVGSLDAQLNPGKETSPEAGVVTQESVTCSPTTIGRACVLVSSV